MLSAGWWQQGVLCLSIVSQSRVLDGSDRNSTSLDRQWGHCMASAAAAHIPKVQSRCRITYTQQETSTYCNNQATPCATESMHNQLVTLLSSHSSAPLPLWTSTT